MHQDFRMHQDLALFFAKKFGRGGVETVEITAGQDISIKPPRRPRTAQDGQIAFKEPRRCAQDALRTAEDTSSCNVDEVWLERIGHGGDSWMGGVRPVLTVTFRLLRADVMFSSHLALRILFSSRDQLEASWAHLARVLTIAVLVNSCGARFESYRIRVVNGEPVLKKSEATSKYLSDRSSTHLSAYYVCFLASGAHTVWVCRLLTWFEPKHCCSAQGDRTLDQQRRSSSSSIYFIAKSKIKKTYMV